MKFLPNKPLSCTHTCNISATHSIVAQELPCAPLPILIQFTKPAVEIIVVS
nr:MAG TPA: hypothetical protein [Caudoviricetes sp.]